jgi:iron complex transport system ATP-binding protein
MSAGSGNAQVSQPVLSARGLSVGYGHGGKRPRAVLAGVDLDLIPGELVCLLGPNGAGKSTLMRTLAGLQPPLAGSMRWAGFGAPTRPPEAASAAPGIPPNGPGDAAPEPEPEPMAPGGPAWARRAAIVLTERVQGGNLTVTALVELGRHPHTGWTGRLRDRDREAVTAAMSAAGALDLRHRIFDELSDGEKQKVMLARALAQEPSLLLLDEPTAFLDLPRRVETMRGLRRLARDRGRAILLSTHDLDLALRASDRLWLLPPGGPLKTGLPEELVLRGEFGAVFDQGDVAFDVAAGEFRIHGRATRKARVQGDPLTAFWTRRALEREGYEPVSGDGGPTVDLTVTAGLRDGKPFWEWRLHATDGTSPALGDLIAAIRLPPPAAIYLP